MWKRAVLLSTTFLVLVLVIVFSTIKADENIPSPTNLKYVNDYAGIFEKTISDYLVSVGRELENKTGAQSVVVTISSLGGTNIESYSYSLFRAWGIGQKEKNNGLLILLAMEDRRWRVEVGKGLEGVITDISSSRVMDNVAQTYFRGGRYGEGIKAAYSSFADSIATEYGVTLSKNVVEPPDFETTSDTYRRVSPLSIFLIFGLFLADLVFNRGRVSRFLFRVLLWSSLFRGGRGGRGGGGYNGGGYGGYGGGQSGGGGSSGGW